jgi:ankyrin repeat protein
MSHSDAVENHRRALGTAISKGNAETVKRLLDFDDIQAEVTRRDLLNFALGTSCKHGQAECVRTVLDLHAQVDVKCEELKFLPLFLAAQLPANKALQVTDIIAQLVLAGADLDARDQDHNGSNALMWAKTKDAAHALLYHAEGAATRYGEPSGSYINRQDNDGKTALMWSVITPTDIAISTFLKDNGSDIFLTDDQGSTVLHWAARSNKCAFAKMLLNAGVKSNITNLGGRTPLHLAVGSNNLEVVQLLLAQNAEDIESGSQSTLDVKSAGGWLPLHVACGAPNVQPTLAWELIHRSQTKHLLLPTSIGKTPVIIAADRGNIAVVEQLQIRIRQIQVDLENEHATLLQRRESGEKGLVDSKIKANRSLFAELLSARGMRDNDGNIALFNAGICESPIAREFLAPWNLDDAVRDISANIPAKRFQAKVVDLLVNPRKIDVGRTSVFDLIYTNPELSQSRSRRTLPRKDCTYRWIHLPANKRSWCRDLFQKYFIELWHAGRIDQGDRADANSSSHTVENDESNNHNGSGATSNHETCTIEHFRKVSRTLAMQRIGHTTHSAYMTPRCRPILPVHDLKFGNRRFSEPTFIDNEYNNDEYFTSELPSAEVPHGQWARGGYQQPNGNLERPTTLPPSLFLYMPYLHFEYFTDLHKMKEMLKIDPTQIKEPERARETGSQGSYSKLLFTGLHGEARDYHQRRTLDQFFYRNITTDERDNDQVVYRYQKCTALSGEETTDPECKIIMVDELWMWIVNDEFIVTSFPERWNPVTKGDFDVWESVLDKITAKGPDKSVPTVYHLAALISDTCSKTFDLCDTGKPRFMDMFEGSLGKAMDDAMDASRRLNQASKQGTKWLRSVSEEDGDERPSKSKASGDPEFLSRKRTDANMRACNDSADDQQEDSMEFVDNLLNLENETKLVYDITDTRDELEILSMVLTWQKRILQEFRSALLTTDTENVRSPHTPCRQPTQFLESSLRTVNTTISDLKRMDKQAERIYATVTTILDIKQKYANAIEARSVRAGGVTIMVFTVATVFFLPASFIISFFGLSLESLPHQGGNVSLSPGLVCGWVLGLGLGVALVYLAIAFRLRTINRALRWIKRKWRASNNSNIDSQRELKKAISSMNTSRTSTGISYTGSQRRKTSSMDGKEEV